MEVKNILIVNFSACDISIMVDCRSGTKKLINLTVCIKIPSLSLETNKELNI